MIDKTIRSANNLVPISGGIVLIVALMLMGCHREGTRPTAEDVEKLFGDDLFVRVEAGRFVQGYDIVYDDQRPAHEVIFSDGFESGDFSAWSAMFP